MNYLRDTRKKVQETITYTKNVSIIIENLIGTNTIRKLIEEKIKSMDDNYPKCKKKLRNERENDNFCNFINFLSKLISILIGYNCKT